MKDNFNLYLVISLIGIVLLIFIVMSAYNNVLVVETIDSLSQEVKQLRYEMGSVNNDLLNMF